MDSLTNRKPYTAISLDNNGYGSIQKGQQRRDGGQLDYKPIPLRLPFLSVCAALFAICIVLVEILLRNVSPYSPPKSSKPSESASLSIAARSVPVASPILVARQDTDLPSGYCANAAALPSQIAANRQSSNSLCAEFTASYKGHTANMSYPMQTAVGQWLNEFNAVTSEFWDMRVTSLECTPSAANGPATWNQVTVDVGCALSTSNINAPCTGFGTMYITGFQLTSGINVVCGVTTSYQLVQTTQPRTTTVGASSQPAPTSELIQTTQPRTSTVTASNLLVPTSQPTTYSTIFVGLTTSLDLDPTSQNRQSESPSIITSQPLAPTSQNRQSESPSIITSQPLAATSQQREVDTTSSDVGAGLGLSTVTLPASTAPLAQNSQTPANSSPAPNENTNPGTVIIGIQTQASNTLVTEVVGSRTTVVANNANTQAPNSQTTVTQVVSGNTVVTVVPVVNSATNNVAVTTVVNGQTVVTSLSKTVVTAIVNGQTIITEVINSASGISKTLVTELVSGETVTTEVALLKSTSAKGTDTAFAESSKASIYTTTTKYISFVTTTGQDGKPTSFSAVVVQTVLATATGKNSTTIATVTRPPQPTLTLAPSEEVVNGSFTTASFFAAQYLPALVAVMMKALWEMVFAATKLAEPFERMNRPEGASAKYSLFAQYLSTSLSLDVVRSISHGNYIPFAAGFGLILIQIGTPLASAAMSVKSNDWCVINGQVRHCDPIWIVNTAIVRTVQGCLGACLLLTILLAVLTRRFRTGISSDPSSFGALALLTNHEQLNRNIQRINPDTDHDLFEEALEKYHFWLGDHKVSDSISKYGIMGSKEATSSSYASFRNRTAYKYNQVRRSDPETVMPEDEADIDAQSSYSTHSNSYTRTSILTRLRDALIVDILGLLVTAGLFGIVVAFYLDPRDDWFNAFFNSGTLISRLFMVALATLAAFQLSHIERVVRITEPFRRLAINFRAGITVPYETTLLVPRSGTPYSSLPGCITLLASHETQGGRMGFQTLVAFTAILGDLNIIAVSGIAYNESQTAAVYSGSSIAALTLSSAVLLTWLVIFTWWRNNKTVKIVRATKGAGTIGGMMRYLGGGGQDVVDEVARIAEDWGMRDDTGRIDGRGKDSSLKPCFGRFMGDDGKDRWCIGFVRVESGEKTADLG